MFRIETLPSNTIFKKRSKHRFTFSALYKNVQGTAGSCLSLVLLRRGGGDGETRVHRVNRVKGDESTIPSSLNIRERFAISILSVAGVLDETYSPR